jgi:hypothetical protein
MPATTKHRHVQEKRTQISADVTDLHRYAKQIHIYLNPDRYGIIVVKQVNIFLSPDRGDTLVAINNLLRI